LRADKVGMGRPVSMAQEGCKTGGLLGQALPGAMTGSPMEALTLVSTLVSLPVCTVTPDLLGVSVFVSAWSFVRLACLVFQNALAELPLVLVDTCSNQTLRI